MYGALKSPGQCTGLSRTGGGECLGGRTADSVADVVVMERSNRTKFYMERSRLAVGTFVFYIENTTLGK